MCGRYNLTPSAEAFVELFGIIDNLESLPDQPLYNIAPAGIPLPVVRGGEIRPQLAMLKWPLIPHWAKEGKVKFSTANAKGETLDQKPAFRDAWRRRRRCLIPAHGFYEWQKQADGSKKPYHIRMPDQGLFAFGGLWDRCRTRDGETIESFTIVTTDPVPEIQPIHSRMPLILPQLAFEAWLGSDDATDLIQPYNHTKLDIYPISTWVNNPRHDDPRCLEPAQGL